MLWLWWWNLWAASYTRPVTVQVTVRVPATIYNLQAERAKRAARQAS